MPAVTHSTRLMRQARPLRPDRAPYYLHSPGTHPAELAPGWYLRPAGAAAPVYLGAQYTDAVRAIDRLLVLHRQAATA